MFVCRSRRASVSVLASRAADKEPGERADQCAETRRGGAHIGAGLEDENDRTADNRDDDRDAYGDAEYQEQELADRAPAARVS